MLHQGLPGGTSGEEPPANRGDIQDAGSILRLGKNPGGGHGNPLQYSCLKYPMDEVSHGSLRSTGPQRVRNN